MSKNLKKWLFLMNSAIIPASSFLLISCTDHQRFQIQEQIASALNQVPYFQIRPIINTPSKDSELNNYTAEALDCMCFIQGNSFKYNGYTYRSKVISVLQNINSDIAEIKTQWTIDEYPNIISYPKIFKISGFKPIPINHKHYVRSDQIQIPKQECLNKYNGQTGA
ncbi:MULTISPECIES: hypothetical protein [unclassified Mycoplasma]|uniref:hypothetical protein n=1 Tax=unclassified Mycoplasma TaxID=2683645 RepID=UPI00211C2090|nr:MULTISPECIES: hypothetical protein [unclassified Mycoplasma]UUM20018.1 hypothetical protein NPA11_01140 [Mycoplasma sp. 1578d]UUM24999.1 hypothetical protein NPA12_01125 [Mycoplasma sp. 3686d]